MNLFTARLTGKMVSTEQFENNMHELQLRVIRYRQVEKSPELAEYYALKAEVESSAFQERKQELINRKYRDTDEGRKTAFRDKLAGSLRMRGYKLAVDNQTFQAFLAFQQTEDFSKITSIKERMKSSELRMFNMIYRSAFYKNYMKVLNSDELKQLNELEAEINSEDFQKRDAVWSDSKRWQHSEEYQKEQRFKELAKMDDIRFFFAQRAEDIDWAEMFRPTFEDLMVSGKNWKPGFGYPSDKLRDGHSRASEHQAYNGGKNTFFAEGRMDIETREETQKALAWDARKGFENKVFSYTSDTMNTREVFKQAEGMFMAKVRSQGSGHHLFGLSTGLNQKPLVAMYYYNGSRHQLGLVDGQNPHMVDLSGVLRSMYHVYTFRWTETDLIWYVNNLEVLHLPNTLSADQMFYLAQSFLPVSERPGTGKLKVQWVRAFRTATAADKPKDEPQPALELDKPAKEAKAEAKPKAAKSEAKPKATKTAAKSSKK